MTDIAVGGPLAIDRFSLGGNWYPGDSTLANTQDRVTAQGANGDYIASQLHNAGTNTSVPYVCKETTGNLVLPSAGAISGSLHVDNCTLVYNQAAFPELTVSGHQHDDNAHTAATATFVPSITCPAMFGCPESLVGTVGDVAALISITYEWGCQHVDEMGSTGDHLAGASYAGEERITLEFIGEPTDPFDTTTYTGWDLVNDGDDSVARDSHDKYSYTYVKAITRSA